MKIAFCANPLMSFINIKKPKNFLLFLILVTISFQVKVYSQTTSRTFTAIPVTDPDLNTPGRGVEQWHDRNDVNVPVEGTNTQRLDVYYRFVWTRIEGPTLGSYSWTYFDGLVNAAIQKRQKFSFGIMTVYPGGTTGNGLVTYDGGNSSYPLYLHTLMQSESVKDWRTGSIWTPNYNSEHYLNRLLALNQAINAHIEATSFNGIRYKDVISCIDIRGYGGWGEWHSAYTVNNVIADYPAGTFPTVASLKRIVDAHTQAFPNFPLVAMIAAFDAQWLQNTWNPPEIAYYVLTTRNTWGPIGWRRDQWGATDNYLRDYLENNNRSFGTSGPFKNYIMERWRTSPITGEPPAWNPDNYSDLERQIKLYHATSFGNGNYGVTPNTTIKNRVRAASKACGYRVVVENADVTVADKNITILLNWKNLGQGPTYENWNVVFELRNTSNALIWSGLSQFNPKLFLPPTAPSTAATPITDNFTLPANIPGGNYNLNLIIKDPNGYRGPLLLAITGRNADSSYTLNSTPITITSGPAPTVTVVDNCGSSVLTAGSYTGSLLWSTGETTPSITVTTAGTYTVTQMINGSTSSPGSGVAAPNSAPAPTVTVANNCGNSVLTAESFTGSLLWSNGATSSSNTVTTAGTYTVTQTVNGCTSTSGSGTAAPGNPVVPTPIVTVTDNCGSSLLTASNFSGSLLWSNGATSASITVLSAGTYTVAQTVAGCSSSPASGVAAPKAIPGAPTVTVTNNCESAELTASDFTGSLLWSNAATSSSITVPTAGTYSVTQTINGCISTAGTGTAAPKTTPAAPTVTVANNCGNSVLTASGFTGSLLWSNGATSTSITVSVAGTYTVTQTVNGCTSAEGSGTAAPINSAVATPTVTVTDNCGSSLLTASDFTGSLLWSNGATSSSITVSIAGTYTVTQSVNGCSSSPGSGVAAPKTIPAAPTVTVTNNCESSVLTASDFTGSLLWSNGATSSSITVPTAGTYSVTQTINGCISTAGTGTTAPETTPAAPTVTVANNCGNSVLTASGFTGSLLWSNGATSTSITVSVAGTYTVTQTVNGCTSAEGSGTAAPINSAVATPTVTVTDNCGSSLLTASDFTGSLLWSNGATSSSITVSTAATYTVTQSVNGCSSSAGSGVAAPKTIPAAPTVTVTNNCESSVLTASDFTGSLLWSNGATTSSITVPTAGTYSVTQTINGCISTAGTGTTVPETTPAAPTVTVANNCGNSVLTASGFTGSLLWSNGATSTSITVSVAGTYTVTQTVNGCTSAEGSGTAAPINSAVATPTVTVTDNCGSSVLTASDYTGSLLWSNGATSSSITVSTGATYTVTQSVNGCSSSPGSGIAAPKTTPAAPTVTVTNNCESSVLTASDFTGSLLWSNGATSSSITVPTAGTYSVTQTINNCTSAESNGVAAPKTIPATPTVTVTDNCGSSLLTASDLTGSILWNNGATSSSITVSTAGIYTITQSVNGCSSLPGSGVAAPKAIPAAPTVTVTNNCESSVLTASDFTGSLLWSNGATSSSIAVPTAGTYSVTQTINGCISTAGTGTAAPKTTPAAPTVTVANNCGNSVLTASGFTGSLLWSNGATSTSITVSVAGTYTVTQTVNGCTSAEGSGTAAPINSAVATPTVTVTDNCGSSVLTASDYTGSLLWSNGATSSSITVSTGATYTVTQSVNGCSSSPGSGVAAPKTIPAPPTVTVTNNCESSVLTASDFTGSLLWSNAATSSSITVPTAGTYSVTQTVNGCISTAGTGTTAPETTPAAPTVTVANNCGNSVLTASGFTGSLLWSNGATSSSITVTTAGTYTVTQTVNGCTSAEGSGTAAPINSAVATPTVTVTDNCGSSVLTASDYTGSLLWSNGATSSSITVSTAATYTVTQSVNGCSSSAGSGVAAPKTIPDAPTVTVTNNCESSLLTASDFTGSLLWSNAATSSSITVPTAGTYSVTQTVNGCISTAGTGTAVPETTPAAPTVTVANNCGNSVLTASGFTGSLLWSNGATSTSITVSVAGTYTVTQTVNGCTSAEGSGTAAPINSAVATPTVTVTDNCGSSVLTASDYTGSLLWSNGATSSSITVSTAATYTVTQSVNGCSSSAGSGVAAPKTIPAPPTITVTNNCESSVLTASDFTGSLLWSNGATSSSTTVPTAGTYSVTQTINGCTSTAGTGTAAPKTIPLAPTVAVTNNCSNSVLTAGSFTGSLLWSNGATTSSITVTTAGTYSVTQTVNGCGSLPGSNIASPKEIPSAPTVTVVDNCGNSVLTASDFAGSLLWSNGATSSSITVATGGTYTVTQIVNGCSSLPGNGNASPKAIPAAPTVAKVDNCGNSVLTAGSFTGSLLWSNGGTSSSITVTTAGTYTVTQTVNGCTSAEGNGVAAPKTTPIIPTVNVADNCGSSLLTASGFTGSLLWSNGATSASITVLSAGTYTVAQTVAGCSSSPASGVAAPKAIPAAPTVTVTNNCESAELTASDFTGSLLWSNAATSSSITVPTAGTYSVTQTINGCISTAGTGTAAPKTTPAAPTVTVANNCGNSVLTASGFTGSLLWSNGATSSSITVTTAGTYTVTQTVNGCTSAEGSGTAAPINSAVATPTVTVTDNCGSSLLTASDFTGSLLWSNGATSSSITVSIAGTYTVTQSVNGCTSSPGSGTSAPKTIPAAPTVTVTNNCESSVLTASDFTGSLLWSNGATSSSITVPTAGTYSVTQTINGCISTAGTGTAAPRTTPLAPTVAVTNNCGNSVLTASGFTGSLLWSNGATSSSITVTTAGTYTVTQTVNGCTSAEGNAVTAPKSIPATPTVSVTDNCGSSVLTASDFTGSLLWSNGATSSSITVSTADTYTVTQSVNGCSSSPGNGITAPKTIPAAPTVTVVNNCESSVLTAGSFTGSLLWSNGATSSSITVSTGGTYSVTQTINNCTSPESNGIAAPKTIPATPIVTVTDNCGSSLLTASDLTGSILWNNGATSSSITVSTAGTYTVTQSVNGCSSLPGSGVAAPKAIPAAPTVTVTNNCESSVLTASDFTGSLLWSNGATSSSITVPTAGTYTVTQTINGCISTAGTGTTAPETAPLAPTVTVVNNCGNSVLTASGFTGSLLWSNGATSSSITVTTAGTYTVTQTVNGCTSAEGSGTAAPINSAVATPTVTVTDNCGSSLLTASDFTGSLLWSNGATSSSITVSIAGTYTVTQSVNGCTSSPGSGTSAPKTIPAAPTVTVTNNCESSVLTASDFTGSLLWSNGATSSSITVPTAGTYSVTQTINGCISTAGTGTAAPRTTPLAPTVAVTNNCGNSVLTASGFTSSLLWSNGATSSSITVTTAGTYTVTQTVNGCTSAEGSGTAAPINSAVATPTVTVTDNCGSSVLTASDYTGSLLWSNGATSSSITVSTAATYTVTQSVNGCSSLAGSGVAAPKIIPDAPTVTVTNNCESSQLTASDFTGSLLWSNAATSSSITVPTAGTYTVTQTVNGCISTTGTGTAAPKTSPLAPTVTVVNNCGNSVLTASGFTGSLLWSNGATSTSITVSVAGSYTVTQTVNGCTSAEGSGTAAPINSAVATPTVTVTDNCGSSVLTASDYTGSLLWSNGATTSSITVSNAGTYTATQSVNGCSSSPGSGTSAPKTIPAAPSVAVINNCESSVLTASGFTGSLLWSNSATSSSIIVPTAGTYTVTQTVNGCTSATGTGTAAPKTAPAAPTVSVLNNCGNSVLTAGSFTGSLLWSNGATSSSITVETAGTYTVTQTVNGCTSTSGSGTAAPTNSGVTTPTVTVTDNCGSSLLSASGFTGSLLWSNGSTSASITVSTAGTYSVTQSVDGCTSSPGSGIAAPKTTPAAPTVTVTNNCESSILTASGFTGSLLWSNTATSSSITVPTAGIYTVTQTVNGCTSATGSGISAPKTNPAAPAVSVTNNCGNSVLTAGSFTGSLLWSNGATTSSITVTTAGTYTVTQTVNGCTSLPGSGLAAPSNSSVATPIIAVSNNCGNSILTAGSFTGSLLWSTGATTTSITVTTPGTYTVTQTVNGCTSSPRSGLAAPKTVPSAPTVTVVNNCGNSVLTAGSFTGSLFWSNGATTSSITAATAGTYTVTQAVNGCTSVAQSGTAAPKTTPAAPTVSVVNNCGNSVLTAGSFTGSLLWSNGATTSSITVTTAGTYTVTQTVNGCTSATRSGLAAPSNSSVTTPIITVSNNCGNSVLTAGSFTGSLLWSNGATTTSITVTAPGTYTVTQRVNGCTSSPASGVAAPKTIPSAPTVNVVNNCGNSVLTAGSFTGSLLWSNGATTSSITVTTAGTYTVTQTVNGCTSVTRSGVAAPKATPVAPTVTVVNNCGNSVLTAGSFTGSLLWSNGATTSSITVTTAGTYTVTQTVNGCTSVTRSGVAAPRTIPALSSNLAATATSGSPFTYTATSATTGTTFAWSRAAVTGITNAAASGTGNINETLISTLSTAVNVTYVYTLTANGCSRTQNVVVTVNRGSTVNCVINGSITSSFTSTSIPAGRYIWFNSSFDPGSLGGGTATVTFNVINSKITFTANSQQYTLNVPNSRIRFINTVTSASTQFINNVWETSVPRNYTNYVFMGGLSYLVPSNLPGNISNIRWTADVVIDRSNTSLTWRWSAATYTSFAAHSGLNIKPINGNTQNPYPNSNNAGTPENFKSSVVSGAKGSGGTNYTGTYSSTSTATCTVNVGQRSALQPVPNQPSFAKQIPALSIENLSTEQLEANVTPNPSNTSFNLLIRSNNKNPVQVRVMNIFGQVVEKHEKVAANTVLQVGHKWASGSYLVEVVQNDQRKIIKVIKVN